LDTPLPLGCEDVGLDPIPLGFTTGMSMKSLSAMGLGQF
jgi:hypothetical protein